MNPTSPVPYTLPAAERPVPYVLTDQGMSA